MKKLTFLVKWCNLYSFFNKRHFFTLVLIENNYSWGKDTKIGGVIIAMATLIYLTVWHVKQGLSSCSILLWNNSVKLLDSPSLSGEINVSIIPRKGVIVFFFCNSVLLKWNKFSLSIHLHVRRMDTTLI